MSRYCAPRVSSLTLLYILRYVSALYILSCEAVSASHLFLYALSMLRTTFDPFFDGFVRCLPTVFVSFLFFFLLVLPFLDNRYNLGATAGFSVGATSGPSLNGRLFDRSRRHFGTVYRCRHSIGRPPHTSISIAHSRANESFLPRFCSIGSYRDTRAASPDFWNATSHWTPPFVACW